MRTLTGHTDWVRKVVITPDGLTAASCSNDQVRAKGATHAMAHDTTTTHRHDTTT